MNFNFLSKPINTLVILFSFLTLSSAFAQQYDPNDPISTTTLESYLSKAEPDAIKYIGLIELRKNFTNHLLLVDSIKQQGQIARTYYEAWDLLMKYDVSCKHIPEWARTSINQTHKEWGQLPQGVEDSIDSKKLGFIFKALNLRKERIYAISTYETNKSAGNPFELANNLNTKVKNLKQLLPILMRHGFPHLIPEGSVVVLEDHEDFFLGLSPEQKRYISRSERINKNFEDYDQMGLLKAICSQHGKHVLPDLVKKYTDFFEKNPDPSQWKTQ